MGGADRVLTFAQVCKVLGGRTAQRQLWDPGTSIPSITDQSLALESALRRSHFPAGQSPLEDHEGSWLSILPTYDLGKVISSELAPSL